MKANRILGTSALDAFNNAQDALVSLGNTHSIYENLGGTSALDTLNHAQAALASLGNTHSIYENLVGTSALDTLNHAQAALASPAVNNILDMYTKVSSIQGVKDVQSLFNELKDQETEYIKNSLSEYLKIDVVVNNTSESEFKELEALAQPNIDLKSIAINHQSRLIHFVKNHLLSVLLNFFVAYTVLYQQANTEERLLEVKEMRELKRIVSKLDSGTKTILVDHRVITGDKVRLRAEPSLKSYVLSKLPIGKLVEVLDSTNRSWLKVSLIIGNEEVEGWVARRYTLSFKK
jgi:hypothetical protein